MYQSDLFICPCRYIRSVDASAGGERKFCTSFMVLLVVVVVVVVVVRVLLLFDTALNGM